MCYTSIGLLFLARDASGYSCLQEMSHYCIEVGIRVTYSSGQFTERVKSRNGGIRVVMNPDIHPRLRRQQQEPH